MTRRKDNPALSALSANGLRVGLAVSMYHAEITGSMQRAAIEAFTSSGGRSEDLIVVEVPGAFELIAACRALVERDDIDAVVALGCVIRGETRHDRAIVSAVTNGISALIVETGVPIAFGVLTCENFDQANQRAGGSKGNKGEEAMHAAIMTVTSLSALAQDEELA
jgi:6,7-dimethyl-8-ribityllumazine synthase